MSKLRVSLCRKNGSDRDLNELPGIAILRPFRSGIQVRSPEIIGSWVRRRRAKVDEKLVARSAVCAPKFDIARASHWRAPPFSAGRRKRSLLRRHVALAGSENSEVLCCASPSIYSGGVFRESDAQRNRKYRPVVSCHRFMLFRTFVSCDFPAAFFVWACRLRLNSATQTA